jgi:hypothetical protein
MVNLSLVDQDVIRVNQESRQLLERVKGWQINQIFWLPCVIVVFNKKKLECLVNHVKGLLMLYSQE